MKYPLNNYLVKYLVGLIRDGNGLNGKRLELLSAYLLGTFDDFRIIWRKIGRGGEYDLLIANSQPPGQPFRWMKDYFLVECKDTTKPVDEKEFGHFLSKLNLTKTNVGIIISRRGLSGRLRRLHADGSRDTAFSQLGIVVLDITLDEINNLENQNDFPSLLQRKYEELRFRIR